MTIPFKICPVIVAWMVHSRISWHRLTEHRTWKGKFTVTLNTLRPRRNEQHFADDIFKGIFFKENVWISIIVSLKFVPKGPIYNIPALVQIMAWRRPGDKPLFETMMVRLLTHICVIRPQWVNTLRTKQTVAILQMASLQTGLILGLHPANERRRYFVTKSLIGWAQT